MHKNHKLLILFLVLVVVSIALNFTSGTNNTRSFEVALFQVADTAVIKSITIQSDGEVRLEKNAAGSWTINDKYGINDNLRTVLLAVLNQVNVRRPVSKTQQAELAASLREGTRVTVISEDEDLSFYVGGNAARTQSYFMSADGDLPYIVEIPGYRNYIAGLFDLTEMQWRDRTIFNTLWRSLQALTITYPNNPESDVNIFFEEDFFKIEKVSQMDTLALMSYLTSFELFEANEFIPKGFNSSYDSLSETAPFAVIELNEINTDKNQQLRIFPKLENDNYLLTLNKDDEMSLVDFGRLRDLLVRPDAFKR